MPERNKEEESIYDQYILDGLTLLDEGFIPNFGDVFGKESVSEEQDDTKNTHDSRKSDLEAIRSFSSGYDLSSKEPNSPLNRVNLVERLIPSRYVETPEKDSDLIKSITPTRDEVVAYYGKFRECHMAQLGLNISDNQGNQQDSDLLSSFLSKKRKLEKALNNGITDKPIKEKPDNKRPKLK